MATKINQPSFSEDESGQKIDRHISHWHCLTDTLVKAGGGLVIGGVLSLLFFKRRYLWLGAGFGLGVGYKNCELELDPFKK